MTTIIPDISLNKLSGKNRRLFHEWKEIDKCISKHSDIDYKVTLVNSERLPIQYLITYYLRSICGIEREESLDNPFIENPPKFANQFQMEIIIPPNYPCVDATPRYSFLTISAKGEMIPHPWHPNIKYFGSFAGRVCLNQPDTYASISCAIMRIAEYLRYERYHAKNEPPYPEDIKVAEWVRLQGEPKRWIYFN